MKTLTLLLMGLFLHSQSLAASWFEKEINGHLLYDSYVSAGVPRAALERTFEFMDLNENKNLNLKLGDSYTSRKIENRNHVVIIDYSQSSTSARLFLLNTSNGNVEKFYVAHGVNSGENYATRFSNTSGSKQTSIGFFLTGSTYYGGHGETLYLFGLENSNNRAYERAIVMHGAPYVSKEFIEKYGRLGRSWGCPAVTQTAIKKLIPLIKNGAILYAYHKDLMHMTATSPAVQYMSDDQSDTSTNSDNIMPEELNP